MSTTNTSQGNVDRQSGESDRSDAQGSDSGVERTSGADGMAAKAGHEAQGMAEKGADAARNVAESRYEQGSNRAASELDSFSDAMSDAASTLDEKGSPFASYASELSDQLASFSSKVSTSSFDELASGARSLARDNPAAFMLGSVALGLAASRFFKATGEHVRVGADGVSRDHSTSSGSSRGRSGSGNDGYGNRQRSVSGEDESFSGGAVGGVATRSSALEPATSTYETSTSSPDSTAISGSSSIQGRSEVGRSEASSTTDAHSAFDKENS